MSKCPKIFKNVHKCPQMSKIVKNVKKKIENQELPKNVKKYSKMCLRNIWMAPKANYTLGADRNGNITVKAPCKNCAAAGIEYGKVPFAKYDGQSVADATKASVTSLFELE
jgi:hypothetical protein